MRCKAVASDIVAGNLIVLACCMSKYVMASGSGVFEKCVQVILQAFASCLFWDVLGLRCCNGHACRRKPRAVISNVSFGEVCTIQPLLSLVLQNGLLTKAARGPESLVQHHTICLIYFKYRYKINVRYVL